MELNDIYEQINSFWDKILPVLILHLVGIWLLNKIVRLRFNLRDRIEIYIKSEKFTKSKALLEEFNLWTKIPYFIIFGGIVYLVVFNNISNGLSKFYISPVRLIYSETQIWDRSWKRDLAIIEYCRDSTLSRLNTGDLYFYKNQYLEIFKNKYPDQYKSRIKWISEGEALDAKFYYLSVLFFVFGIIAFIFQIRKSKNSRLNLFLRYLILFLLTAAIILVFRYRWETKVEKRIFAENSMVASGLIIENKLNVNELEDTWHDIELELIEHLDRQHNSTPWLLSLLKDKSYSVE